MIIIIDKLRYESESIRSKYIFITWKILFIENDTLFNCFALSLSLFLSLVTYLSLFLSYSLFVHFIKFDVLIIISINTFRTFQFISFLEFYYYYCRVFTSYLLVGSPSSPPSSLYPSTSPLRQQNIKQKHEKDDNVKKFFLTCFSYFSFFLLLLLLITCLLRGDHYESGFF